MKTLQQLFVYAKMYENLQNKTTKKYNIPF